MKCQFCGDLIDVGFKRCLNCKAIESGWHMWVTRFGLPVCNNCGIVKNEQGNKPCKGRVAVTFREKD